jgi:hypothetical protein
VAHPDHQTIGSCWDLIAKINHGGVRNKKQIHDEKNRLGLSCGASYLSFSFSCVIVGFTTNTTKESCQPPMR